MTQSKLNVLVTGATGTQGGFVARKLLENGHQVRALTRNPSSPAARDLKKRGADIVQGNFDEPESLKKCLQGMDSVFAMGTPEHGVDTEIEEGKRLADMAHEVGVKHYLYSSVAGAHADTGISFFESKAKIEKHIQSKGLPYTFVAPVYFMDNLVNYALDDLRNGKISRPMPGSRKLHQVAAEDIGSFCALVFENREPFLNQRFEISSDFTSGEEEARILSEITGRQIRYEEIPIETARQWGGDYDKMFEWFNRVEYQLDSRRMREDFPEVKWHSFKNWAEKQDWQRLLAKVA